MLYFSEITPDMRDVPDFLPMTKEELSTPDFVLITGDAYVDHPSYGAAVIGKLLWAKGYTVGVIAAPRVTQSSDPLKCVFDRPRLAFLVTSGNVDSMVNNYTVSLKKRRTDEYAAGGRGHRPDRAVPVYCKALRKTYGDVPIIIGGLEASLRRLGHYDYWSNSVRPSILLESTADLLVYGMGERQILSIAEAMAAGVSVKDINYVDGTCWKTADAVNIPLNSVELPAFEEIKKDKAAYAKSFKTQYGNTVWQKATTLVERYSKDFVVQNPPAVPLTRAEMDLVHGMKFSRLPHPMYQETGDRGQSTEGVPGIKEVRFSIISSRGCFGGCSFCALSFHQGKYVTSRSHESIIAEAIELTKLPDFKGYIHDVGGPTANFRQNSCEKAELSGYCTDRRCLAPKPCKNLNVSHADYLELLRKLRALPGVKKVFIRSGIRFDYVMADSDGAFMREMTEHHISGQLKIAPEHVSDKALRLMGKPGREVYDAFCARYKKLNEKLGKEQFLVPYLMSSHPGSGLKEAVELAEYLRDNGITPQQVQDFYPTPSTISTCMYHTGINPLTGESVYAARSPREKAMQRALIQYKNPKNRGLVIEALVKAGREDLIGYGGVGEASKR